MPTPARCKTKRDTLPFPPLPDRHATDLEFFLSSFIRDQAAVEALETLLYSKAIDERKKPALFHGLAVCINAARNTAKIQLDFLIQTGGLLYAWNGTTALDAGVPA